jgi:hypothetical protein
MILWLVLGLLALRLGGYIGAILRRSHSDQPREQQHAPSVDVGAELPKPKGSRQMLPEACAAQDTKPTVLVWIVRTVQFVGLTSSICSLQTKTQWVNYLDVRSIASL